MSSVIRNRELVYERLGKTLGLVNLNNLLNFFIGNSELLNNYYKKIQIFRL